MSTRKSLFFSFLDRYASLVISVVSSMVIARLLTPAELGTFSVTMVLLALVSTVRDMGAGQYLVQEKALTTERIRAVWAVQLGLGLGLACLVLLASYPVAVFYKEPLMRDIMLVVALSYAVNPFGSLTYAWLMREMRFESVALMRFLAGLTGAIVSIFLAWEGFGPISLAFGAFGSTMVSALVATYFRPKSFPWLPGVSEISRVLSFGSRLTVSSIVREIANGAPEMLLGKLQDLTAAGLYSRSNGLVQMFHRLFVDAVGAVCMPWFAVQSREKGNFVDPFLRATSYVTAFGWSFCLGVVFLAQPIVRALYGNQWDQSVDLVRLLAIAMIFGVPAALCGTALTAAGQAKTIVRVTVLSALQTVAFTALGASHGLVLLGFALIVSSAVDATLRIRATSQHIDVTVFGLLRALRSSALVALVSAIGPGCVLWAYGPYPDAVLLPLVLGAGGGLVGFVFGIVAFGHPLREEILMVWSKITFKAA